MKYLPISIYVVVVTLCLVIPSIETFSGILIIFALAQLIAIPCLLTSYFLTKIVHESY